MTTSIMQNRRNIIHYSVRALLITLMLASVKWTASGEEPPRVSLKANSSSWRDLLCYKTRQSDGATWQLHLVRLKPGGVDHLFSKELSAECYAPICMGTSVVITDSSGKISKFDLKGETVFSEKAVFGDAASKFGERFDERLIVMDKTIFKGQGQDPSYELVFVDVSADRPIVKGAVKTQQVLKVTRVIDSLFACNSERAWKIELPLDLK